MSFFWTVGILLLAGIYFFLSIHYYDTDLNYYFFIAKKILSGNILYLELFDHKPPLFHIFLVFAAFFFGSSNFVLFGCCLLTFVFLVFLLSKIEFSYKINLIFLVIFMTGISEYGLLNGSILIFDLTLKALAYLLFFNLNHRKLAILLSMISILVRFDLSMYLILCCYSLIYDRRTSCFCILSGFKGILAYFILLVSVPEFVSVVTKQLINFNLLYLKYFNLTQKTLLNRELGIVHFVLIYFFFAVIYSCIKCFINGSKEKVLKFSLLLGVGVGLSFLSLYKQGFPAKSYVYYPLVFYMFLCIAQVRFDVWSRWGVIFPFIFITFLLAHSLFYFESGYKKILDVEATSVRVKSVIGSKDKVFMFDPLFEYVSSENVIVCDKLGYLNFSHMKYLGVDKKEYKNCLYVEKPRWTILYEKNLETYYQQFSGMSLVRKIDMWVKRSEVVYLLENSYD